MKKQSEIKGQEVGFFQFRIETFIKFINKDIAVIQSYLEKNTKNNQYTEVFHQIKKDHKGIKGFGLIQEKQYRLLIDNMTDSFGHMLPKDRRLLIAELKQGTIQEFAKKLERYLGEKMDLNNNNNLKKINEAQNQPSSVLGKKSALKKTTESTEGSTLKKHVSFEGVDNKDNKDSSSEGLSSGAVSSEEIEKLKSHKRFMSFMARAMSLNKSKNEVLESESESESESDVDIEGVSDEEVQKDHLSSGA